MQTEELIWHTLCRMEETLERIISRSRDIETSDDYYLSPGGMERLESTCMLLIAIGESVKNIDKLTGKEMLPLYPEIDWKGVMGLRDVIAHHYFDLDGDIVCDVVKNKLPDLLATIRRMKGDLFNQSVQA